MTSAIYGGINQSNLVKYRKMENFRVVQFSQNFVVGQAPRKFISAEYFPSLPKVKAIILNAIIHKSAKIPFCNRYFLYINQTRTRV